MDLREQIARAIAESGGGCWERLDEPHRRWAYEQADAVLAIPVLGHAEEMREALRPVAEYVDRIEGEAAQMQCSPQEWGGMLGVTWDRLVSSRDAYRAASGEGSDG